MRRFGKLSRVALLGFRDVEEGENRRDGIPY
jgi:hypothetical protein